MSEVLSSNDSLVALLSSLKSSEKDAFLKSLSKKELQALQYHWPLWARPNQLPPTVGNNGQMWRTWLLLAGRGFGKTRTGAEWIRWKVESGQSKRIGLIAPTTGDARDVIVEGDSGIMSVCPPWFQPEYQPSKRRIVWPNGALATVYAAEEPERLRGPQHDTIWADELCAWRYPQAWDMAMFGLRLGKNPQVCISTTPKPTKLIKELLRAPTTALSRGTSYDNRANLAPAFFDEIVRKYEGTRLGRQELEAEILEDVIGALWNRDNLDQHRLKKNAHDLGFYKRIVVAIDPAVTSGEDANETGIVVCGLGQDDQGYILDDQSGRYAPEQWARLAIRLYTNYSADRVVAEVNNGGDLVEATLRTVDKNVAFTAVRASRGKLVRAEPISALYEQGRVHHVGAFPALEDQMCMFTPDLDRASFGSPDRVDALVWGITELMVQEDFTGMLEFYRTSCAGDEKLAQRAADKLRAIGLEHTLHITQGQ